MLQNMNNVLEVKICVCVYVSVVTHSILRIFHVVKIVLLSELEAPFEPCHHLPKHGSENFGNSVHATRVIFFAKELIGTVIHQGEVKECTLQPNIGKPTCFGLRLR